MPEQFWIATMRNAAASPDNIDITTIFASIRKNLLKVALIALAAGAITYTALSLIAPRYASQAEINIKSKGATNPFTSPRAGGGDASQVIASQIDKQAVNTHVLALQSPDLISEVAEKLRLNQTREFNSALGPLDAMDWLTGVLGFGPHNANESERDRVLSAFFERLVVYSPVESRLISLTFSSADPQRAADVANTLARTYRERLAANTVQETNQIQNALQPKIEQLTAEVQKADGKVAQFRSKSGLIRGGAQKTPLDDQQLADLTAELTRASGARSALHASSATARDLINRGTPEVIPHVQRSPIVQNLIQQRVSVERDLRKYSATMKPAHPVIRQLNADLSSVKRQISIEVANVVASIDKEVQAAIEREVSIKKSLDKIKTKVTDNSGAEAELRRLEGLAQSKRAELDRLLAQFEANRAATDGGAVPVAAEIVSQAQAASVAVYPKKGPFTFLVMAATFLGGMAIVISSALLTGTRPRSMPENRFEADIATAIATPLPSLAAPTSTAVDSLPTTLPKSVSTIEDLSVFVERVAAGANAPCRTMIVAKAQGERAGEVGRQLAINLSKASQNTIVVDWNTRGQSAILADYNDKPMIGIMDLLNGSARFGDVLRALPDCDVHVIACGTPLSANEQINPGQMNMILDALDATYNHILIVAEAAEARRLFETIEGRIEAGIWVEPPHHRGVTKPPEREQEGTFLGFTVNDLDVTYLTSAKTSPQATQKTSHTIHAAAAHSLSPPEIRSKPAA